MTKKMLSSRLLPGCLCPSLYIVSLSVLLLVSRTDSARSPSGSGRTEKECRPIENILKNKGFSYPWWNSTQSTTPTGCILTSDRSSKCCPRSFDTPTQRREMSSAFSQNWFGTKLNSAGEVYKVQKTRFDVTFKQLLQRAHTDFHSMFERTYGMLYIQHAHVFHALFTTLEKYYDDGRDPLESKLNEFFAILTRKMFEVLNAQYDFNESYLSCATIVISEKQGNDLHRQIVSSLRRSFVATRALAQGLLEADRVIMNLQKLDLSSPDCLLPLSQMLFCPICAEGRAYKPCHQHCYSITSKCLMSTQALAKPWLEFSKALDDIIDRLLGPYNVEAVVEPIHIKISEAIMNFQESGADLSQAVFSKCGKPTLKSRNFNKREAEADGISSPSALAATSGNEKDSAQTSKSLEKLLRETKTKVKKSKTLWNYLPRHVCNAISKDFSSQSCWNGTALEKPGTGIVRKVPKGDTNEDESMENKAPSSTARFIPNSLVTEQIFIIQLITEKLKTAFNGGDIQWVQEIDADDDFVGSGMGSGSGEVPTDLEDSDDDDPSGQIIHHTPTNSMPDHVWKPTTTSTNTNTNPPITASVDKISNRPIFPGSPSGIPPAIIKHTPNSDDEEEDEDEDDEDDDSNLNINSRNNNDNRRGNTNSGSAGIDFGGFVPPPIPEIPRIPIFNVPSTTTSTTTTPRPTTSTTTTRRPVFNTKDREKPMPTPTSPPTTTTGTTSGNSMEVTAGKTVAVVKLFTPVLVSMLGKLFSLS